MHRLSTTLALGVALLALAPDANARGGTYRGPSGAVPPMLREPTDPTPPWPGGGLGHPVRPPSPPLPPSVPPRSNPHGTVSFADWHFWYHHNQEVLETRSSAALALARDSKHTQEHILPALLSVLAEKTATDPHVRHAALIALGKVATTQEHVDLLRKEADISKDALADESAIIALGLLRRSDATRQFDAEALDAVRAQLFRILVNNLRPVRSRAFAGAALGLLGDQPTRATSGGKALTEKIFGLLGQSHRHPGIPASVLLAVGLQKRDIISEEQRKALRAIVETGEIAGSKTYVARAHAAIALGRVGTASDANALMAALQNRAAKSRNGKRSAAIALGTLAPRVPAEARTSLIRELIVLLDPPEPDPNSVRAAPRRLRDSTTRCNLLITLARIAAVDLAETDGLTNRIASIQQFLRKHVVEANRVERPYAALALAQLARAMRGSKNPERLAFRRRTGALLRAQLADKKIAARHRAGLAIALGLMQDTEARAQLLAELQDLKQDWWLRAACARALGLLGATDGDARKALEAVLKNRRSDVLRIDCAAGLGLLGSPDAGAALLADLAAARSMTTKGPAAAALANLGSREQTAALAAIVKDAKQPALLRSVAAAALGRIGDPEPVPSLARITAHMNFRASTDFLNELFSLL